MTSKIIKMSAANTQVSSIMKEVKKEGNGKTLDASKLLAAKLSKLDEAEKKLKDIKKAKSATATASVKQKERTVLLVAHVPQEKRSKYQLRPYLHPSYRSPEWEKKDSDLIALKTLYIDSKGVFQLWNAKTATELIHSWIIAEKIESFVTADVEKKFKIFGGGITDITRYACKKLEKNGVLEISKSKNGKKEHYSYEVVKP